MDTKTFPSSGFAAQQSYWIEFQNVKKGAIYIRSYRDSISRLETWFSALRAITSSSSIAGWLIWKQYAYLWAVLIGASQIADALRNTFPLAKRREALSEWCNALDRIFVVSQRDWETIYAGHKTEEEIAELSHRLRSELQRTEEKIMPHGLHRKPRLEAAAEQEMELFFKTRYLL